MIRVDSLDKEAPQYTLIFLHGLGDSSKGWTFISEKLREFNLLNNFNFVFLDSPTKKLSLQRLKAKAWYDFKSLHDVLDQEDEKNILESYRYLVQQINEEHSHYGIDYDKIIIGGFSQGCALSLLILNCINIKIGGIICLSGYLPLYDYIKEHELDLVVNKSCPVFVGHGAKDKVINLDMYQRTVDLLEELGFDAVTLKQYKNLGHSCNDEEITDIFKWLVDLVDAKSEEGVTVQ